LWDADVLLLFRRLALFKRQRQDFPPLPSDARWDVQAYLLISLKTERVQGTSRHIGGGFKSAAELCAKGARQLAAQPDALILRSWGLHWEADPVISDSQ
jgi:hypothetical protein